MIKYPYLPEGREILYVGIDNKFMAEAKIARETLAGDTIFPVGVVIVKNDEIVVRVGNGFNTGSETPHVCPRVVENCASGEGYDLCTLHDPEGHAEAMAVKVAKDNGIDIEGADIYLYGHWWCCQLCWDVMIEAGIKNVYLLENANVEFSRENVYASTLQTNLKTAYIAGALTNVPRDAARLHLKFYEKIGALCEKMEIDAYIPHINTDSEVDPH